MDTKPTTRPATVSELCPSPWLCAADLAGRRVRGTIAAVAVENVRQRDGTTVV